PEKPYVNLENLDTRSFASEDPRGFLNSYSQGAILDEIQRVPPLFSYLQEILDDSRESGLFILTGSNNFLLQENISQSLDVVISYLQHLALSDGEIGDMATDVDEIMLRGGHPTIYEQNIYVYKWYANYIRTYVERDVRLIKNIGDLPVFEKFLR